MLDIWNPRLEVAWSAEEKAVLDAAILLAQGPIPTDHARYAETLLTFLYQLSGADEVLLCQRSNEQQEMKSLQGLLQGQTIAAKISYPLEGTPCTNVNRHGVLYFPSGVQNLFPEDTYLKEHGIQSYFGAPLLGSDNELLGIVAILHRKPLPNPQLLEFVLTILSPALEMLLEAYTSVAA